jgi:hypothetical protein
MFRIDGRGSAGLRKQAMVLRVIAAFILVAGVVLLGYEIALLVAGVRLNGMALAMTIMIFGVSFTLLWVRSNNRLIAIEGVAGV